MQNNAKAPIIVETHLVITEVIDGDSIKVASIFNKDEKEIRLYGIDCPENKYNRKMVEDEKKLHTPAEFLLGLGQQAHKFVLSVAPVGMSITLQIEKGKRKVCHNTSSANGNAAIQIYPRQLGLR